MTHSLHHHQRTTAEGLVRLGRMSRRPVRGGAVTIKRSDLALIEFYCQQAECVKWLNDILVEEPLQTGDLQEELRDGTVLIRILNTIFPGLVPFFHPAGAPKLKLVENIELFLEACRRIGLKGLFSGLLPTNFQPPIS